MNKPKLEVGMWVTAKQYYSELSLRGALQPNFKYQIIEVYDQGVRVRLNDTEQLSVHYRNFDRFFELKPQGCEIPLADYISEVTLRPSEGFTVDVENSDLSKGIIKYKKIEPKLPTKMEDLGDRLTGWYIDTENRVVCTPNKIKNEQYNHNVWPSKEWAESVQAQCKLVRLRDAWNGEWKPDFTLPDGKATIRLFKNQITVVELHNVNQFLCFSNSTIANAFLDAFRELIETYLKPYKS